MSGSGAGSPGNGNLFDSYPISKGEFKTFWDRLDTEKVIKQTIQEVEAWPEWIKRNCEAVFGKRK